MFIKNLIPFLSLFFLTSCNLFDVPIINKRDKVYDINACQKEELNFILEGARTIDYIVVNKSEHKMYLYKDDKVDTVIPISLGQGDGGPKKEKGDNNTPEGDFFVTCKHCSSEYYRAMHITYPRLFDTKMAKIRGVNPGGSISIHAQPKWNASGVQNEHTLSQDWTEGCIAITNKDMQIFWRKVKNGTPIKILGKK